MKKNNSKIFNRKGNSLKLVNFKREEIIEQELRKQKEAYTKQRLD